MDNFEYGYGGSCCGNGPYWGYNSSHQTCCDGEPGFGIGDVLFNDMV